MTLYSPLTLKVNKLNKEIFEDYTKINCSHDSTWIAEFIIEDEKEV